MAMAELRELGFDEAKINGGGLNVTTTFDAEKQAEAVKTMQAKVKEVAAIRGKKTSQLHGSTGQCRQRDRRAGGPVRRRR